MKIRLTSIQHDQRGFEAITNLNARTQDRTLQQIEIGLGSRAGCTIASAVIQELIELAREMREAQERGEKLGLTETTKPSRTPSMSTTAPSKFLETTL